jgi:hypothetical protein
LKRLALIVLACAGAVLGVGPQHASAAACSLPAARPLWIDYADGSVPFWQTFAQPGVIAAAANFIFPPQLRAHGAKTVYWDMYLRKRVGAPTEPADPAAIAPRANRFYEYAAMSSACSTPMIAENELFGAGLVTPWSAANAQYRANVLAWLQALAARGAHPVLLINSNPYTGGDAADWWRRVAKVADIVRESYFPAPAVYAEGPVQGSRDLRNMFRQGVAGLLAIGIPPARLGIMLGFHTTPGTGGRERLEPAQAWYEVVKLQVLAAKQVARELHLASVWSWGWAHWKTLPGEDDPDKAGAACVYLWTRDRHLCDGPSAAGPGFDASLTEGQLRLPKDSRCTIGSQRVLWDTIRSIQGLTGDGQAAFTAAFARAVAARRAEAPAKRIAAAERLVVNVRFGGSRAAYVAALARAHATVSAARGVIADELRRSAIAAHLRVATPSSAEIESYAETYANAAARLVEVKPGAPWLGGTRRGYALASNAPAQVFGLPTGKRVTVNTFNGVFKVRALGPAIPLGALPLDWVRPSITAALKAIEREDAYGNWLLGQETTALGQAICWRDQLPAVGAVPLTDYLPFLDFDGGAVPVGVS